MQKQQRVRGADVIKIVNYAETEDQLMENLNIVYHMKKNIGQEIPLSGKWTLQQTVASDRSQTWRVHVSLRTELWTAEFQGTAASAESENHA